MSNFIFTPTPESGISFSGTTTNVVMEVMQLAGPPGPPGPTGVAGNPYTIMGYTPLVNGVQNITLPFEPVNVFVYLDGLLQGKTDNYSWVGNILTFTSDFNILTTDSVLIVFN